MTYQNTNEKQCLNTILASQLQTHLLHSSIVLKVLKFCIQLIINPIEGIMIP
jgi:hypothetical protein